MRLGTLHTRRTRKNATGKAQDLEVRSHNKSLNKTFRVLHDGQQLRMAGRVRKMGDDWLVFVHGWGCCKDCFSEAFERDEFAGKSLCAIDLIGFGDSDKPADFSYDLSDQAILLTQAVQSLRPKHISFIGHSMGGGICLLAAPLLGDELAIFVSVEGNLGLPNGSVSPVITRLPFQIVKAGVFPLIKLVAHCSPSSDTRKLGSWLGHASTVAFYRSAQSMAKYAYDGKLLGKFAALPSKVYCYGETSGRLQTVVPHLKAKGIKCYEIPCAGHLMMLENPDVFYQTISKLTNR